MLPYVFYEIEETLKEFMYDNHNRYVAAGLFLCVPKILWQYDLLSRIEDKGLIRALTEGNWAWFFMEAKNSGIAIENIHKDGIVLDGITHYPVKELKNHIAKYRRNGIPVIIDNENNKTIDGFIKISNNAWICQTGGYAIFDGTPVRVDEPI